MRTFLVKWDINIRISSSLRLIYNLYNNKDWEPRKSGTAEPLDKNRFQKIQPTLGFLSAISGKYWNYERGHPQVLNGLALEGLIL